MAQKIPTSFMDGPLSFEPRSKRIIDQLYIKLKGKYVSRERELLYFGETLPFNVMMRSSEQHQVFPLTFTNVNFFCLISN